MMKKFTKIINIFVQNIQKIYRTKSYTLSYMLNLTSFLLITNFFLYARCLSE
nr:MAG TPA: hypothetical protein [Caudoviricetes sp.]